MKSKNKQRGYIGSGMESAFMFVVGVVLVVGILLGVFGSVGVPWLWGVVKPWLHSITG